MSEKKIDLLSEDDKNELKQLLEDFSLKIKSKEEVSGINTNVDKKIIILSSKIEKLETKQDAEKLLSDLEAELLILNEYKEFKELLSKIENKLDSEKKKYATSYKKELSLLQKGIIKNKNLSPGELKKKANEGRKNAVNEIEKGIVAKLAERDDWIGFLAKKALK